MDTPIGGYRPEVTFSPTRGAQSSPEDAKPIRDFDHGRKRVRRCLKSRSANELRASCEVRRVPSHVVTPSNCPENQFKIRGLPIGPVRQKRAN
jgi:hypothetical protein